MSKHVTLSVKDAVHKIQLALLQGIHSENQLFSAGSLLSRSDYQDVVIERSIGIQCGYPLCTNSLPSNPTRKGRYRISLKEHKVYDLHESYMYCSSECVINSRAFESILQENRSPFMDTEKLNVILRLFSGMNLESDGGLGRKADLGFSELKIQENVHGKVAEVPFEEWVGPSNAIDGYVPQVDRVLKNSKTAAKSSFKQRDGGATLFNEMDFMSTIITQNEYNISKAGGRISKDDELKANGEFKMSEKKPIELDPNRSTLVTTKQLKAPSKSRKNNSSANFIEAGEEGLVEIVHQANDAMLKSSLKFSGEKKMARTVTWADENTDGFENKNICEFQEMKTVKEGGDELNRTEVINKNISLRCTSAEVCAAALSLAAEAVVSGESEIFDAVTDAGIIIFPCPNEMEKAGCQEKGECVEETDVLEPTTPIKWSIKHGISSTDFIDSGDSWYDPPPEGFSLTLSPFATMWNAIFGWMTSSSLAYLYGKDESSHEDFLIVNETEYPRKVVLSDGRSSEIKQTLAGCLARALPGLVTDLKLPTPLSSLEQGLGRLLETMSFMDALPSFQHKQWQVLDLLFLKALSVCRIPSLAPHMTGERAFLHKVLDGTQISIEEFAILKDMVTPYC